MELIRCLESTDHHISTLQRLCSDMMNLGTLEALKGLEKY